MSGFYLVDSLCVFYVKVMELERKRGENELIGIVVGFSTIRLNDTLSGLCSLLLECH
jgi:hypothetical protein